MYEFAFINIIVSIVQQNIPYKTYMKTSISFLRMSLLLNINIIVSIVKPTFHKKLYLSTYMKKESWIY